MKMRSRLLIAGTLAALVAGPAVADLGYNPGSVTTIFDFICFTTKHCSAHVPVNSAGTETATGANPFRVDPTGSTTQPVSAASLPLPAGAATAAKQPALGAAGSPSADVITVQGAGSMTPLFMQSATAPVSTMNSASANAGVNAALAAVFDDTSPTAITENSFGYLRMSANRNIYGTIRDGGGNERGANVNAANQLTVAVDGGSVFNANGVATPANSSPVVLPYTTSTTGNIAANNVTAVVVNAAATTLMGAQLYGIGSAPAYLKIYNATTATCGSGTPVKRLMIPAASTAANGAGSNITFGPNGLRLSTGFTYCVTTGITDADATAPAASTYLINLDWL